MTDKDTQKVTFVCATCGGDNLLWDAYAEWDVVEQKMVLQNDFDHCDCQDCGGECKAIETAIARPSDKQLAYLRDAIENENISYGEIAELLSIGATYPEMLAGDVLLLEWAGVPETKETTQ